MLLNKNNFLSVGANALPSDLMYALQTQCMRQT